MSSENALMQTAARFIIGESVDVKVKGTKDRVKAFKDVLLASRNLYEALESGHGIGEVTNLLDAKHEAAKKFKEVTGVFWAL